MKEVVLIVALRVVPLLAGDVSAVLIGKIVWFSCSPVGVIRPLVTLLPSPVTCPTQNRSIIINNINKILSEMSRNANGNVLSSTYHIYFIHI